MINWILLWLYFKAEFMIDWGVGSDFELHILPSIRVIISDADEEGHRAYTLCLQFLIFSCVFTYCRDILYRFNNEGEIVGKRVFPECSIMQLE